MQYHAVCSPKAAHPAAEHQRTTINSVGSSLEGPRRSALSLQEPRRSALSSHDKTTNTMRSVHQRLDALEPRLSWLYIRLLLLTGVSWAVHASVVVVLIFTRTLVANDVGLGTRVLEILGASIFIGAVAGGPLFGHLADAYGRRTALLLSMGLSLAGLAVSALVRKDYLLIVGYVIAGVGLGGQLPSTIVLVQELSPRSMSGRMVALLEAFTGIGGLLGVALAFAVAPRLGWSTTYLVLCGCVLYTGVLRFTVPESPRWLASIGRVDDALAVLEQLEVSHGCDPSQDDVQSRDDKQTTFMSTSDLNSSLKSKRAFLRQIIPTLVLWTLWIITSMSSYALGIYVPTLISLEGFNMYASWSTIALLSLAQVFGCLLAASVLDIHGRKRSIAGFATLAAIVAVVLSYLAWSRATVIVGTCLVTAFLAGSWSCVLAYTPENFATAVRCRGVAYAFAVSRLAAAGGSLLYPHMFNVWVLSVPALTWVFAGSLAVVAVGLVPHFGYNPTEREEGNRSSAGESETDMESGLKSDGGEELSMDKTVEVGDQV
ncbi:hypothetical protein BBJ28_00024758 [Nothophytophthora sp. Chile5]|nr:hypothetical protein BBJ28_00024758 [Nothophytophthora sp. Chile5]